MGQVGQPDTGDLLQGDTTPLPEGTVWQTGATAYGKVARDPDTQKITGVVLIGESAADEIAWAAAAIARLSARGSIPMARVTSPIVT